MFLGSSFSSFSRIANQFGLSRSPAIAVFLALAANTIRHHTFSFDPAPGAELFREPNRIE
jgi:hypothetical protein